MDNNRASNILPKLWIVQQCTLVGEHSADAEDEAGALLETAEKQM